MFGIARGEEEMGEGCKKDAVAELWFLCSSFKMTGIVFDSVLFTINLHP